MRPALAVLAALALAGCGSQAVREHTASRPRIPRPVASELAVRSDALAAALRRGDACAARIQAHGLERQARKAVGAGWVPQPFRQRLLSAVRALVVRLPACVPPPPPAPPPPAEKAHGKDKGNYEGKKHGHGHGDGEGGK